MTSAETTTSRDARRFARPVPIRFAHCDPAGIIFFPQYLVLFNGLVEDWFNEGLDVSYADMLCGQRTGLPIVHLECDFRAITRMGETVEFGLSVARMGSSSITLDMDCRGADGVLRVSARKVLVFTSLDTHEAIAAPEHIRAAMERWMNEK
ncbi:acyl-CoA thioesterase [Diaphorobacter caeni]|uniref:acyl-CoA thioesterase n=1 Tax=Diaphorobacter caeni TaxID=2784387 RepID=UPI00188F0E8E|nr:thioesterase family protein [Diaphorobacter caeni]MBF5007559.1 acyl-CoA thioesterase [Diaphorobacter caeni]